MINHRGWFETSIPKNMNTMALEDITTQKEYRLSLNQWSTFILTPSLTLFETTVSGVKEGGIRFSKPTYGFHQRVCYVNMRALSLTTTSSCCALYKFFHFLPSLHRRDGALRTCHSRSLHTDDSLCHSSYSSKVRTYETCHLDHYHPNDSSPT